MIRIGVLISIGRHPASGVRRSSLLDSAAIEMALSLPDSKIELVHAGDPGDEILLDYLGLGCGKAHVISTRSEQNAAVCLTSFLREARYDLLLAGQRSEAEPGTGMVPYTIAQALDVPLMAGLRELEISADRVVGTQFLARGRRRRLACPLPAIATVAVGATPRRYPTLAARRAATISVWPARGTVEFRDTEVRVPVRPTPRVQAPTAERPALERFQAMTDLARRKGVVLTNIAPAAAARAILGFLAERGMPGPRGQTADPGDRRE